MRDDERRQAAAQRCAELANARGEGWEAKHFLRVTITGVEDIALNAVLQLDGLARIIERNKHRLDVLFDDLTRQHILPEPKPSPVERLAGQYGESPDIMAATLAKLGLELREKSS